jgi:hypothetical protein
LRSALRNGHTITHLSFLRRRGDEIWPPWLASPPGAWTFLLCRATASMQNIACTFAPIALAPLPSGAMVSPVTARDRSIDRALHRGSPCR